MLGLIAGLNLQALPKRRDRLIVLLSRQSPIAPIELRGTGRRLREPDSGNGKR